MAVCSPGGAIMIRSCRLSGRCHSAPPPGAQMVVSLPVQDGPKLAAQEVNAREVEGHGCATKLGGTISDRAYHRRVTVIGKAIMQAVPSSTRRRQAARQLAEGQPEANCAISIAPKLTATGRGAKL